MELKGSSYDVLKWVALVVLPALGTLYFTLAQTWVLPYGEEVVGSTVAVELFLGTILGVSTAQYNKNKQYDGSVLVGPEGPKDGLLTLSLNQEPEEIASQKEVRFKVENLQPGWDE